MESDQVRITLTVIDGSREAVDCEIEASPSTPAGAVLDAMHLPSDAWYCNGHPINPAASLMVNGIHSGVTLRRSPTHDKADAGLFELTVESGRMTGRSWELRAGSYQIGRVLASIVIDDPTISRLHAELQVQPGSIVIRDLQSSNGTFVNDKQCIDPMELRPGDPLRLGDVELTIRATAKADAALEASDDLSIRFNRPGRFRNPRPSRTLRRVADPHETERPPFPWATLTSPIAVALIAMFVFQRPEMMLLAAVGPIASVAQYVTQRRRTARRNTAELTKSDLDSERYQAAITAAIEAERQWLVEGDPDLTTIVDIGRLPTTRLWERRPSDPDFLAIRIGTRDLPSDVKIESADPEAEQPQIPNAPVILDLRDAGVTAISGPPEVTAALLRALIMRIAVLHAPNDVRLVCLIEGGSESDWAWARWLPHLDGRGIPTNRDSIDSALKQTAEAIKVRLEIADAEKQSFSPEIIVIASDAHQYRSNESFLSVLRDGPSVGVRTVAIDTDPARIPAETTAQVIVRDKSASVETAGADPILEVAWESLSSQVAESVAREMAPLRLSGGDASGLPAAVRLIDLLADDIGAEKVKETWSSLAPTTRAIIGVSEAGPFDVDLVRDGPHTLIAGTTGSGKTELLQSLLGSLAIANPPAGLAFLLVDYKGGGDFADLVRLPHTLGLVSNLDERLTQRAITALKSEVQRRQSELAYLRENRIISEANVRAAWGEAPNEALARHLGRLVIVVDEFAQFARNLPSFVEGLVQVTEQGRSLGMHLIISVQRPAGAVSGALRANMGLRIALRTERGESIEVLETAHADLISRRTPGRGYVRLGDPPSLVEFQSARVGGTRPDLPTDTTALTVNTRPWNQAAGSSKHETKPGAGMTDLSLLVEKLQDVFGDAEAPPSPWPPVLPELLSRDSLSPSVNGRAIWGLVDQPGERDIAQRQIRLTYSPKDDGNLAIVGSARSGRTTALLSLATSLAEAFSPQELQIVAVDLATGGLDTLGALPHVAGVVLNDLDLFERYVERFTTEIDRRRNAASRGMANGDPRLVLLIDGWQRIATTYEYGSDLDRQLQAILRDGPAVGISSVVAGDTTLSSIRTQGLFQAHAVLRLDDPSKYLDLGIDPKKASDDIPPGRGILAATGSEFQIAFGVGGNQSASFEETVRSTAAKWDATTAAAYVLRVDPLPARLTWDEADSLPADRAGGGISLPIGVGGDDLRLLDVILDGGFVVGGRRGSGKSNTLSWMAARLTADGIQVICISGARAGSIALRPDTNVLASFGPTANPEELAGVLETSTGPVVILIDDAPALLRRSQTQPASMLSIARLFVEARGFDRAGVVVAGDVDDLTANPREAIGLALSASSGLLFGPSSLDARAFGARNIPERFTRPTVQGRGVLIDRGTIVTAQVPFRD